MARESSSGPGWARSWLTPGASIAGYQLENRVGAGGTAVVFRARDERLDRTVALKILTPDLSGDAEFRERFIRESRAAAAVDHPHIIPVYAAGEADGMLYIAMRFVAGGDLHSVLDREGPLSASRAAAFISPVASALDAAHAVRLVHRDVKPANILVDRSPGRPDHPYLSDFGLSKDTVSAGALTATGLFIGTPDFCAPEQIGGKAANVHTDQYSLACVAYTLLTGAMPFARDQQMAVLWAHMSDPPPLAIKLRPDLPAAVDTVLGRALAKAPDDRFGSCGEFADSLRSALGLRSYSSPTASAPAAALAPPTEEIATIPPTASRFTPTHPMTAVSAPAAPAASPASPAPHRDRRPGRRHGRLVAAAATIAVLAAIGAVTAVILGKPSGQAPAGAASWQAGKAIDAGASLTSVSCPADGSCVAADSGGNVLHYNAGTWAPPTSLGGSNLAGVSCASAGFCAAVTNKGTTAYIYSGGKWTASQLTGADGGPAHLTAVSCPADGHCVATGGLNVYQYAGGTWSRGTQLKHGGFFTSVSCPAVGSCVAVDDSGEAYGYSHGSWAAPVTVGSGVDLTGVSCSSPGFCAAVSTGATAYVYSGGKWTGRNLTGASGHPAQLTAISCPADGHCVATGAHDAYQYTGGAWSRGTHIADSNALTSVSCSAGSFCAAVDDGGDAFVYR